MWSKAWRKKWVLCEYRSRLGDPYSFQLQMVVLKISPAESQDSKTSLHMDLAFHFQRIQPLGCGFWSRQYDRQNKGSQRFPSPNTRNLWISDPICEKELGMRKYPELCGWKYPELCGWIQCNLKSPDKWKRKAGESNSEKGMWWWKQRPQWGDSQLWRWKVFTNQ